MLKSIELFAGAGGLALGTGMAGFHNEARQILATKRGAAEPELFREIADEIGQAIADQQKVP